MAFFELMAEPIAGQRILKQIKSTKGLVAVWNFSEEAGMPRQAKSNMGTFNLL